MARGVTSEDFTDVAPRLIMPATHSGALPMELAALLPTRRHNDDLLAALPSLGDGTATDGAIAAVFAADPFINVRLVASALHRAGIESVVNFPSVAQYGEVFEQTLAEVGLGLGRELSVLGQFRDLGLRTYQTLAAHPRADFDPVGQDGFVIAMSFDDLHRGAARDDVLNQRRHWALAHASPGQPAFVLAPSARDAAAPSAGSAVIVRLG